MRPGQSFENSDVADHYQYRPDYPPALLRKLVELSPGKQRALDLGCGTGKVARRICHEFDTITAVDASCSMLGVGRRLQEKRSSNIEWLYGLAEETSFENKYFDLIIAASSIHWMDHSALFPHLRQHVKDDHLFAVVEGDSANKPLWQDEWDEFLRKWIFELKGEVYEPKREDSEFAEWMTRHKKWLRIEGDTEFTQCFSQPVDHFVLCQYSRDTFARARLGSRVDEFELDLRNVVEPFASSTGLLTYNVKSTIEWGVIRQS